MTLCAPVLGAPKANAVVAAIPALTWSPVKGAVLYEYQLAADNDFGSIVLGNGHGKGTADRDPSAAR